MDIETITSNVEEFIDNVPVAEEESEETIEATVQLTDLYQQRVRAMREPTPQKGRGSDPHLMVDLADLLDGGIQEHYKKVKDDSELLRAEGDRRRAELLEQQYMNEWFYPTVDALIRLNSMEDLLANQEALETFDALAIVPGGGRADGYTSVFVSSLYEGMPDQTLRSDAFVTDQIRRINRLADDNQIRAAISLAQNVQAQIDRGEHKAEPTDYEFLQKIALRG